MLIYASRQERHPYGRVVELVDSLDSGSSVHCGRAGSSPASPTKETVERLSLFLPVHGRQKQHNSLVFQENRKTRELFHSLKSFLPICNHYHLFQSALSAELATEGKYVLGCALWLEQKCFLRFFVCCSMIDVRFCKIVAS